jgi:hypothetical protein
MALHVSVALGQDTAFPLVNLARSDATPLDAIKQVALQTQVPVGLIFGLDQRILCSNNRAFSIQAKPPLDALTESTQGTGYTVRNEGSVLVVSAPDVSPAQQSLLDHHFESFSPEATWTMAGLGAQLTGWLWLQTGIANGFSSSTLYSITAKRMHFSMSSATTMEIANHIVSLDGKGMWVFKIARQTSTDSGDEMLQVFSYQEDERSLNDLSCN